MRSIYRARTPRPEGYPPPHARTRDPGPAEGPADARVPALQGARRLARRVLARQLRVAVPHAPAPGEGRRRAERGRRRGPHTPQEHLRDHGEGREALLRIAAGDAARQHHRGHQVPGASGVLPLPAARDEDPAAGAPPGHARGPAQHHQGLTAHHTRARRHVHALADGARPQRHGIRHRLARRSDRSRAHTGSRRRGPGGHEAPGADPSASQKGAHIMSKVRLAIVGVGNCASSLVQGLEYYKDADPDERVPGLMHVELGGYHIRDIEVVAAFDVDAKKVGKDVAEAIFTEPNNTIRFADVPDLGVTVQRGPTLDGLGKYYREMVEESPAEAVDVAAALRNARADVLVSYLPVGSEQAQKHYAQACLDAGVALVNALPVFIASDPVWAKKFEDAGVPIVGDDIKSQVGATITHRVMAKLFEDRGVTLDRTYQLNVGGNMDFKNMLERDRLESKKISKTQAVTSNLGHDLGARNVHIGPSDYVQWLDDRKWAYVRLEGRAFGDVPLNLEYKLEVWDSPNSAGIIIDAVRAAKIALDRGIGGPIISASTYLMKSPPVQMPDDEGRAQVEAFIRGDVDR